MVTTKSSHLLNYITIMEKNQRFEPKSIFRLFRLRNDTNRHDRMWWRQEKSFWIVLLVWILEVKFSIYFKQHMTNYYRYIPKMSIYQHLYQRQHEEQTDDDLFINKQLPLSTQRKDKALHLFFTLITYVLQSNNVFLTKSLFKKKKGSLLYLCFFN